MDKIILTPKSTRNAPEDIEWQKQCYGMTEEELCKDLAFLVNMNARFSGEERNAFNLASMSILSDAQEATARDQKEMARQFINKAKWLIAYHMK